MIRILKFAIAAAIACTILVSCANEDGSVPAGFKKISDPEGIGAVDYDLFVPKSWTADLGTGVTSAYVSGQDPSNISVMAFESDGNVESLEQYWEKYEPSLKAIFPDYMLVNEPEEGELDGAPAMEYVYTATVGDTAYKFTQVVAAKETTFYVFTYTATADKYDSHIEEVIEILDNFRFHK